MTALASRSLAVGEGDAVPELDLPGLVVGAVGERLRQVRLRVVVRAPGRQRVEHRLRLGRALRRPLGRRRVPSVRFTIHRVHDRPTVARLAHGRLEHLDHRRRSGRRARLRVVGGAGAARSARGGQQPHRDHRGGEHQPGRDRSLHRSGPSRTASGSHASLAGPASVDRCAPFPMGRAALLARVETQATQSAPEQHRRRATPASRSVRSRRCRARSAASWPATAVRRVRCRRSAARAPSSARRRRGDRRSRRSSARARRRSCSRT